MPLHEQRVQALVRDADQVLYRRTDHLFAGLLVFQWLAGIALAIWLTPFTWVGSQSSVHVHVWVAVGLGLAILSLPLALIAARPGRSLTRHTVAVAQMLAAGLLIHLTGGRIETHFHIFGSLAFLSFYCDWRVLITASVVTALDHLLRGAFWPQSIYGLVWGASWRWLEHAGWVGFIDIFLFFSCWQSRLAARVAADRQARLEETNASIEAQVASRTAQLHESEQRVRLMIDGVKDYAIFMLDTAGRVATWNSGAEKINGFAADEVIGQHLACFYPPTEPVEKPAAQLRAAVASGRFQEEGFRVRKNGELYWADVTITHLQDCEGRHIGFGNVIRDITERKNTQQALRDAKEAAEAANRAKSDFLANMSHEIRTPMNGIMGLTDLLLDGPLSEDQRESLGMVRYSAHSLMSLINDILDFSKIEAGRLELDPQPFVLRQALLETLKSLRPRCAAKGLALRAEFQDDVPDDVIGDANRLQQILINMVGNAIKFTEQGEIVVRAALLKQNETQYQLQLSVADTGIGIPADKHQAIFEAFAQADGSTTRKYGGTGLGLSICTRLVNLMGGRVSVESTPGKGSTFSFDLWLARPLPTTADQQPIQSDENAKESAFDLGPLKILLAEDNPVNQRVAVRLLEKRGHQVTVAGNGREALAAAAQQEFDLVLMDVQMPELDGLAATEAIRRRELETGEHVPIVAMTAHAMKGDRDRCLQAGMDDYVSKPIEIGELLAVLRRVILERKEAPAEHVPLSSAESRC